MIPIPPSETSTQKSPLRICLFGGTFDPIHLGHTHIAAAAVESLELDQVIFLPCHQSPHKAGKENADGTHRLCMSHLATADLDWAKVDDFDLKAPQPCYSWRTVEAMQKKHPRARMFWLMGTDQWRALPRWNRPDHLAELVEFIVFARGAEPDARPGYRMHAISGSHPASATAIREGLYQGRHDEWLHPDVLNYIEQHSLYQGPDELGQADD